MNRSRMQGITLVELMIAMVLGLVVIGGAISLTLANRQSYRTNEGLSQLQESARTALELMARDIRQAGVTGCDNNAARVANTLNNQTVWWRSWFGIRGFPDNVAGAVAVNATVNNRRQNTDAIRLQGIQGRAMYIADHIPSTYSIELVDSAANTGLAAGDILVACDFDHSAIFRVSTWNSSTRVLTHVRNTGLVGNCSGGLGFPTDCSSAVGNPYDFDRNTQLGRVFTTEWYIGNTLRAEDGGFSLFRQRGGPTAALPAAEEIVSGVVDMQLTYRVDGATGFVEAGHTSLDSDAEWATVNAVQIVLTVESADARVSTSTANFGGRLHRPFTQIVTLRNRVP